LLALQLHTQRIQQAAHALVAAGGHLVAVAREMEIRLSSKSIS
jgi:hypothetical protein